MVAKIFNDGEKRPPGELHLLERASPKVYANRRRCASLLATALTNRGDCGTSVVQAGKWRADQCP